jgi:hypothetical protein
MSAPPIIAAANGDLMEEADTDIPIDPLLLVQDPPTARARGRPVGSTASTTRTRRQQEFEDSTQRVSSGFERVEDAYSQRQEQELGSQTQGSQRARGRGRGRGRGGARGRGGGRGRGGDEGSSVVHRADSGVTGASARWWRL